MQKSTITASLLSMALTLTGLTGCGSDPATSPSGASASQKTGGSSMLVDRPISGDCALVGRFIGPVTQEVTGTCQFSHMGRTTISFIETVNFQTGAFESHPVLVAANGDELHLHITGVASPVFDGDVPVGLSLLGSAVAEGGTGRFTNATGQLAHSGVVQFGAANTATYHIEGRLSY